MKILQVIPSLGMGGAENMCETLTYNLINYGNEVVVVSLYNEKTIISDRLIENGVKVLSLNKHSGFDFSCIKRLKKVIKDFKPNVIHTHLYSLKYVILATLFKRINIVHTFHSIAIKEAPKNDRKFNGIFFRNRKVIPVAISENIKNTIKSEYKFSKVEVPIIYNGSDLSKCIAKKDYRIDGAFKIINVARFSKEKNHNRLINSFALFNKKYSDSELWLIGSGELQGDSEKLVEKMNLKEKVKFLGVQSDVRPFLQKADCFVLTSDYEGMPITIIEAMATGLPIISTNVGGVPNMITNNKSGILVEPSENQIKDAFVKLFLDKDLREKLGKEALKSSIRFSAEEMACRYLENYRRKR